MHKTVALGRVVPPKRHLKLEKGTSASHSVRMRSAQAYPESFL